MATSDRHTPIPGGDTDDNPREDSGTTSTQRAPDDVEGLPAREPDVFPGKGELPASEPDLVPEKGPRIPKREARQPGSRLDEGAGNSGRGG